MKKLFVFALVTFAFFALFGECGCKAGMSSNPEAIPSCTEESNTCTLDLDSCECAQKGGCECCKNGGCECAKKGNCECAKNGGCECAKKGNCECAKNGGCECAKQEGGCKCGCHHHQK